MATRRQKKVSRVVKEAASEAIQRELSDPRITGLISVTSVDMSPDLRRADIYLSIYGTDEKEQIRSFEGIKHARSKIQSVVAQHLTGKFCPTIQLHIDEKFKKTLDTLNLIDKAMEQVHKKEEMDLEEDERSESSTEEDS